MDQGTPMLYGVPLKYVSLVTLTVQNSALILIMHYSRIMPVVNGARYFTSTAVFLNEILKLVICVAVVVREKNRENLPWSLESLWAEIFGGDAWKLTIPAALYTLQNNLQYIAVSNLDAATFQVTYQLKILTTALFSVTLLRRTLSLQKWLSLVLLTSGVALVQLPTGSSSTSSGSDGKESFFHKHFGFSHTATGELQSGHHAVDDGPNATVGLIAVFAACMLSGLAGVYFEKVLKGSNASLWVRNVQLSFFSLFPALFVGVLWKDGSQVLERGFFYGYNPVVWTAIGFQAIGGIVVALCVAYADNILKNFATSVSILISFVASVYFFNFVVTSNFVLGCGIVLFATYLYTMPERAPPLTVHSRVASGIALDEEGKVGTYDDALKSADGRDLKA